MTYTILQGDNRTTLKTIPDNSIDAVVTDPPYLIDFLGKTWDSSTNDMTDTFRECLRVLKPGGHILAFSAARTYHKMAQMIESAGFEIRDQIMWIYSSGFPKSQDVGRQLYKKENGKPDKQRFDPKIMIKVSGDQYRHPTTNKIYRVLPDINGDRLKVSHEGKGYGVIYEQVVEVTNEWSGWGSSLKPAHEPICLARKPLKTSIAENVQRWGVGALNIDATRVEDRFPSNVIGEIPEYQKFFYCPKVSRTERHINNQVENNHPTVKPVALMEYLIRLITPPGGRVLDPFNGSGSTGMAAVGLGYEYTGCELDPHYVAISKKRIDAWLVRDQNYADNTFDDLFE